MLPAAKKKNRVVQSRVIMTPDCDLKIEKTCYPNKEYYTSFDKDHLSVIINNSTFDAFCSEVASKYNAIHFVKYLCIHLKNMG